MFVNAVSNLNTVIQFPILGAIALAEAFGRIGTLEEVQMPQNGIYHAGITALSEAFAKNPNMRHINLNDNTFTAIGAQAMAKNALPHLKNLQVNIRFSIVFCHLFCLFIADQNIRKRAFRTNNCLLLFCHRVKGKPYEYT